MKNEKKDNIKEEKVVNKVIFIKDGEIITGDAEIFEEMINKCDHKCGKCDNCFASICTKVHDVKKESIDKYPYISYGFQEYDSRGECIRFVVDSCDNYCIARQERDIMPFAFMERKLDESRKSKVDRPKETYLDRLQRLKDEPTYGYCRTLVDRNKNK